MEKYICIMVTVLFIGIFGSLAYENYAKKECRIEAIKANKTVEEIRKICQ